MILTEVPFEDPFLTARRLAPLGGLSFLDSALADPAIGRWSYVAAAPAAVFRVRGGQATLDGVAMRGHPLEALRRVLGSRRRPRHPDGPPFQGGAIGVIAYEAGALFEPAVAPPAAAAPQIDLAFYDIVHAFDHIDRRGFVMAPGPPPPLPEPPPPGPAARIARWTDSRSQAAFEAEVATLIEAIRAGDLFQANLAHRFEAMVAGIHDPLATHARLRAANPAPFAALIIDRERVIWSTSPERFIRLDGRRIETRPIKGTARRETEPSRDAEAAARLAASEKDRAENVMIVDLLRNDLSRVAEPDSVEVPRLCAVETYARVHHLVSTVTARLRQGLDIVDLLAATFPGGSVTGAPKIKAMEWIARLERAPRGPYCGAIGWIGDDGSADFNIAIRTLVGEGDRLSLQAGGGITLLSDPAAEHEETLAKAEAIRAALR